MSHTPTAGPRGWLRLYLILAIMGGILFFMYGILLFSYKSLGYSEWAFWVGGAALSAMAVGAWKAFAGHSPTALSAARCCLIIFLLTALFFIFGYPGTYTILVCSVLLMMSLGWTAMWWAYLSGSKQVRKLMETTPCISPIGKKTVIGVATVFLIVIAVNYIARLNYRHDLELRQLESRMRTERLLAEYASNVLDDESLEDSAPEEEEDEQTPAETMTEEPAPRTTPEPRPAARQDSAPVAAPGYKTVDTKFLTLTVPDIYSYKMHTEDGILLYNFDNEDEDTFFSGFMLGSGTLDQCFTAYQIKTSQPEIEKMFAECLDITLLKPDTKTKSAPYQCNGNTIIRVRYTTVYLDEYKYEADCFIIYNESKNRGCYIQSNWGEDSSPLKKIAESIRFK